MLLAQAAKTGKPPNILEKMVDGRMRKVRCGYPRVCKICSCALACSIHVGSEHPLD